jgi:hypothetical protein
MACNEAPDCCWNAEGAEISGIFGVFVETELIDVSKIALDALWELVLVYEIEDKVEVWFDSGD